MGKKADVYRFISPPHLAKIAFATQLSVSPVMVETEPSFLLFLLYGVWSLAGTMHLLAEWMN